jgi:hypothetical protein
MKMPTTPPIKPATELIAEAGTRARFADAAGPARVEALVPPVVLAAVNVVAAPVAPVADPPPVGAAAVLAKMVGLNRLGPDCATTAGPADEVEPVLPTNAVVTGADATGAVAGEPATAAEPPLDAVVGRLLTAANKVFGMARLARLGPAGICFSGAEAIGVCPVGVAVPAAARTPTVTAAVIIVVLVAIAMPKFLSRRVPSKR